jgi:hypothetical protein
MQANICWHTLRMIDYEKLRSRALLFSTLNQISVEPAAILVKMKDARIRIIGSMHRL